MPDDPDFGRHRRARPLAALALSVCSGTALAQNSAPDSAPDSAPGLAQSVEIAAHRALARVQADAPLAPFTTDGCSGGMSAIWDLVAETIPAFAATHGDLPPWESCCVTHDRAYHAAGPFPDPRDGYAARRDADTALRACVRSGADAEAARLAQSYDLSETTIRHAYDAVADAMYNAVRLGGGPCSGLPWRWGYGYPNCIPRPQDYAPSDQTD